ncbi:MAG: flagellar biosynthesis protein FlhF [Defluviitaleaceae bacterium]|nr:flagellar biosynthesis protein FlhF [Defluviitaleaceae bacterium]
MKLKRFEGRSEEEAIEKVREELGASALILSVRKVKPVGVFQFFKSTRVEVTAAYDVDEGKADAKAPEVNKERETFAQSNDMAFERDKLLFDQMAKNKKISEQQMRIENLENELKSMTKKLSVDSFKHRKEERVFDNRLMQIFYDTLASQDVMPEIAMEILNEIGGMGDEIDSNINLAVRLVYNKILSILSKSSDDIPKASKSQGKCRTVMLMGPTGVGKTTTIAKLSSNFILQDNYSVGLITADTYRIAAVDQLKTYADILGIEVGIVYEPEELVGKLDSMLSLHDIIIVDTAGRSHKNWENFDELRRIIASVSHINMEKYLVLSMTSKYEDMLDIIEKFSEMCDFRLILTKLDETSSYGSILNICYKTGIKVDYLTTGQNVPDDIEKMKPEKVAKALLGMEGVI